MNHIRYIKLIRAATYTGLWGVKKDKTHNFALMEEHRGYIDITRLCTSTIIYRSVKLAAVLFLFWRHFRMLEEINHPKVGEFSF